MGKAAKVDNVDNGKVNAGKDTQSLSTRNSTEYAHAPRTYKKPVHHSKRDMTNLGGRPKIYGDDDPVWQLIIDGMSSGRSLSTVLRTEGMPVWSTVQGRLVSDDAYRAKYDKAVQDRADRLADEIMDLADEPMPEWLEGPGASAWVQQKRLQVDARKWVASKLKPRTYGDRLDVSVTDNRISVLGALEQAQQRVAIGMAKESNVLDVEVKQTKEHAEVTTPLAERMNARMSE